MSAHKDVIKVSTGKPVPPDPPKPDPGPVNTDPGPNIRNPRRVA